MHKTDNHDTVVHVYIAKTQEQVLEVTGLEAQEYDLEVTGARKHSVNIQ
jgi:hypothetical protein